MKEVESPKIKKKKTAPKFKPRENLEKIRNDASME
jgi:hypothetical protein